MKSFFARLVAAGLMLAAVNNLHPVEADDWPCYGHDRALTGRCAVSGDMAQPVVCWTLSTAGTDLSLELSPAASSQAPLRWKQSDWPTSARQLSILGPLELDIDGSGAVRPVTETHHERWAQMLPDVAGCQRVAWNYTWTDQAVCRLQMFAYDAGNAQPRLVWETDPPEGTIFNPLNVVYDIDQDGVQEICVAAHYRIMIFEATTGRKESELKYHSCRPYGWFGLADVDADGQYELVTIGDFQSHIDVIEFDPALPEPERLSVKWRRDIETDIEKRTKWPQVSPRPVIDVTGDDCPEIVLNLFNDLGDGQWHTVVLDARTGATKADLPQRYFLGAASLCESQPAELFVTCTNGVVVQRAGLIELVQITDESPLVTWQKESSAWCTIDLPRLGSTWSTTASQGMQHVMLQGHARPVFFVKTWEQSTADRVSLTAWQADRAGQLHSLWQVAGLPARAACLATDAAAIDRSASLLVRTELAMNRRLELTCTGVQPQMVQHQPLGIDVSLPVVARTGPDGEKSIMIEVPGREIAAIAPPSESGQPPSIRWQRPGRGMRDGSRSLGLLAADVNQDGQCEVVAADQAVQGHAVLTVHGGDGQTIWQKPFEQTPGDLPVWNIGALTFWWDGQFRGPDATDLFVNVRRGLMHSDVGHLLDGTNGNTIWTQTTADVPNVFHWGYAGTPVARADLDHNGCDELVSLQPVCFWIADGRTGMILRGDELASRKKLPAWAAYGEPMVFDFDGDGTSEILLDSPYILALLEQDGSVDWHGPPRVDFPVAGDKENVDQTTQCKHALLDIDADGIMEIASAGYGDGVRVIDPRTGRVLWSLDAPKPNGPKVASANVDGVGGDELIYSSGSTLIAITGDANLGRILWQWQAPATLSMPAIADVDGDGKMEIVVQDAQATIYCLDGPSDGK